MIKGLQWHSLFSFHFIYNDVKPTTNETLMRHNNATPNSTPHWFPYFFLLCVLSTFPLLPPVLTTILAYVTEAATRAVVRISPLRSVVSVSLLFRSRTAGSRHVWTRSRPRRRTQSRLLWMRSRASRARSGIWALHTHWYREASVFEREPRRRR